MNNDKDPNETDDRNEMTGAADGKELSKSTYYRNKEKFDPANPGNREEGSPKDINDPFYGTGSDSRNIPAEQKGRNDEVTGFDHKDYDAKENSAGSHSSTQKQED